VDFKRELRTELEKAAAGVFHAADGRAAVAGGVGIDDVAVGLGLEIEGRPRAGEDGAQVVGALFLFAGFEGVVEELAVVVDGGGDVEGDFLRPSILREATPAWTRSGRAPPPARSFMENRRPGAAGASGEKVLYLQI
jgi:hypothetical protein